MDKKEHYDDAISSLTIGTSKLFILPLLHVEKQIIELMKKQQILIEQLHNENLKLAWSQNSSEIQEIYGGRNNKY
ncbi:Snapin/Pallidin [Popillia japonica]|uniref:Snapin/Pallidin n=1 Tax=Popillia japonica TaxID=7064 RepID=A0AAW1MGI0_POPJA